MTDIAPPWKERWIRFPRGNGMADVLQIDANGRKVEIYVSPAGRSVRVWVDDKEIKR